MLGFDINGSSGPDIVEGFIIKAIIWISSLRFVIKAIVGA